jgi:hypothetical protein
MLLRLLPSYAPSAPTQLQAVLRRRVTQTYLYLSSRAMSDEPTSAPPAAMLESVTVEPLIMQLVVRRDLLDVRLSASVAAHHHLTPIPAFPGAKRYAFFQPT